MTSDRLGTGYNRLGRSEKVMLSVTIPQKQMNLLEQLRVVKGVRKSEMVSFALDLVLALPPEEIAARVEELRTRKASDRSE